MLKNTIILLLAVSVVYAETSVFSTSGPGDLYSSRSSYSGLAEIDSMRANSANFAAWADMSNTYFNLSVDYIQHDVEDYRYKKNKAYIFNKVFGINYPGTPQVTGQSSSYDDVMLSGFNFALPFGNKNVLGLSLTPVSIVNTQNLIANTPSTNPYQSMYYYGQEKRKGSFNNFSMIYGKACSNLSFAADLSVIFGSINETTMQIYKNGSSDSLNSFNSITIENNYQTSAFVINPGLSAIYKWQNYAFAGKISIPVYNKFEKNDTYLISKNYPDGFSKDNSTISGAEWPISMGFGFSWQPDRWKVNTDLLYTFFEGNKLGLAQTENYVDYWKVSISAKYHHSDRLLSSYEQRMTYKFGLSVEQRPVTEIMLENTFFNSRIYDYTAFGSIVTPFAGNRAALETSLSFTLSGDQANNGLEDQVWRLGFTFHNSNSWWLKKSRYED